MITPAGADIYPCFYRTAVNGTDEYPRQPNIPQNHKTLIPHLFYQRSSAQSASSACQVFMTIRVYNCIYLHIVRQYRRCTATSLHLFTINVYKQKTAITNNHVIAVSFKFFLKRLNRLQPNPHIKRPRLCRSIHIITIPVLKVIRIRLEIVCYILNPTK